MMDRQPLPIINMTLTVIAVGLCSLFAQFLGFPWVHGVALMMGFLAISSMLFYHAWIDHSRTKFSNMKKTKVLFLTVIIWIPFVIVLIPGVGFTIAIDMMIESLLIKTENATIGTVELIEEQVEETVIEVEAVPTRWWYPPDWFKNSVRNVEKKVMRTVQREVLHPAPIWLRTGFAGIYSFMRMTQLVLFTSIVFIFIRSFIFLYARSALFIGSEITFRIP